MLKKYAPVLSWLLPLIASTCIVYAAAISAKTLFHPPTCTGHTFEYAGEWYTNWDGQWYKYILQHGYSYQENMPEARGPKVFFPFYPMLGRVVHVLTGLKAEFALLAVTWGALVGFCLLWQRYCRLRLPEAPDVQHYAMLLLLFWPTALFLRMAYTESLFLLLVCLLLYGMHQRWRWDWLVLVAGLSTATRPTGVVCALVLGYHIWLRLAHLSVAKRATLALATMGAACWGLWLYMAYLQHFFGDALFFARAQSAWGLTREAAWQNIHQFFTFWPLWHGVVDPPFSDDVVWYYRAFANEYLWLILVLVSLYALYKQWFTREEALFSFAMLGMIYTMSLHRDMDSVGRYGLAVLPAFMAMARLLPRNITAVASVIAICAALLFAYSGMFAKWDCIY